MLSGLFNNLEEGEQLQLPEADVLLQQRFLSPDVATSLLHDLIRDVQWRAEEVFIAGRRFAQPRLIAWFGDAGVAYRYSGISLVADDWSEALLGLKLQVESRTGAAFNSVLLNYYRNERDSMGMHSDDEPELGAEPLIACVSLGETRTLLFQRRSKGSKRIRLPLENGSLLLMKGQTQRSWRHGIDKELHPCGPRVSLTFRRILS